MPIQLIKTGNGNEKSVSFAKRNGNGSGNLRMIAQDSPPVLLFSSDGSSLTGWTNNSTTVDNTIGNPIPSFKTVGNAYLNRDLGTTFINRTIKFDINLPSTCDSAFIFANTSAGTGTYRTSLRMKQSATATLQGLSFVDNGGWQYAGVAAGGETTLIFPTANVWSNIKILISSSRVVTWYVNGALQASTVTIPVGYATADSTNNFFGFNAQLGGSLAYWDNFEVFSGIV